MGNLGEVLEELEEQMQSLAEKLEKHGSGDQSAHGNWAHGGSKKSNNVDVVAPSDSASKTPTVSETKKPKSDYVSPASTKRKFSPQEIEDAIKNDDIEVFRKLTHTGAMRAYTAGGVSRKMGIKAFEDGIRYWEQKTSHGEKPVKLSSLRKPKRYKVVNDFGETDYATAYLAGFGYAEAHLRKFATVKNALAKRNF